MVCELHLRCVELVPSVKLLTVLKEEFMVRRLHAITETFKYFPPLLQCS